MCLFLQNTVWHNVVLLSVTLTSIKLLDFLLVIASVEVPSVQLYFFFFEVVGVFLQPPLLVDFKSLNPFKALEI